MLQYRQVYLLKYWNLTNFRLMFQFTFSISVPAGGLTFLSLNKKVSKEFSLGEGLNCLLPQTKPPPLSTPPGALLRKRKQGFGAVKSKIQRAENQRFPCVRGAFSQGKLF